jgi:hypothetical protein
MTGFDTGESVPIHVGRNEALWMVIICPFTSIDAPRVGMISKRS